MIPPAPSFNLLHEIPLGAPGSSRKYCVRWASQSFDSASANGGQPALNPPPATTDHP
jgi:hypothetical protein